MEGLETCNRIIDSFYMEKIYKVSVSLRFYFVGFALRFRPVVAKTALLLKEERRELNNRAYGGGQKGVSHC